MTAFLRRYALASWLIALMFLLVPVADAATNAWPFFLDSEQWRFGATGILSGYLVSMLFGLLMLAAIGVERQQKLTLRIVGACAALLALLLVVASISYVLDTLQVRSVVREDQAEMFRIGAVKTAFKMGLAVLGSAVLAVASFKAARDTDAGGN